MPTPNSQLLKFWPVPRKGVYRHIPAYELPDDALWDSKNVTVVDGELRPRTGWANYGANAPYTGAPMGSGMFYKTDSTPVIMLVTISKIYSLTGTTLTDRTGAALTSTSISPPARMTTIVLGTPAVNYVILCNGKDAPQQWDGAAGTVSAVAGSPPVFSDVTTIDDKIVGLVPPYNVQWSPTRRIDSWPALNYKQAAETADPVVAIRAFGIAGGVLYKERSIWIIGRTGEASDARAYRFDQYGLFDGPASPRSVVEIDGAHMYMTANGRIAYFDGQSHRWVADGIWPLIRAELPSDGRKRIYGWYDRDDISVNFVYPVATGGLRRLITIMLPRPETGLQDFGCFYNQINLENGANDLQELGAVSSYRSTTGPTLTIGFTNGLNGNLVVQQSGNLDITAQIPGYWQTGLTQFPDTTRIEGVETFAERASGYGSVNIRPVTSWVLAGDGTLGQANQVNLSRGDEPSRDLVGMDSRSRFFGLRYEFSNASTNTIRYKGAAVMRQKQLM